MGEYTFNLERASAQINAKVDAGISRTLDEIYEMARELAPVRKKSRRKPKTKVIGSAKTGHSLTIHRQTVTVTSSEMYRAYKLSGGKVSQRQFSQLKVVDRSRNKQTVTPEEYDARSSRAATGKTRGIARGSVETSPHGHLRDRIEIREPEEQDGVWKGSVVSMAEYSRYVEFPTSRTAAQPYLLPAFKAARSRLKANIKASKGG